MKKLGKIVMLVFTLVLTMTCFAGVVFAEDSLTDGTYIATTPVNNYKIAYKLTATIEQGKVKSAKLSPWYIDVVKSELSYASLDYMPEAQRPVFKKMLDDAKVYSEQLVATSDATKITKISGSDEVYNALQTTWKDMVSQDQ